MILRLASAALLGTLALLPAVSAQSSTSSTRWISYQNSDGTTVYLDDNRKPALYTQNYGDCLGNSLINVTRFDAAYYQDNMTVLFHLAGNSALLNESVMMYIGVYAYGSNRFDLTFNPCNANIYNMCPINKTIPISANGIIPVAESDVSNIPAIALTIPDFEGEAILRIFANSTQSEIGCYSAVVTNGNSFSQPASVGTILGLFTLTALVASFATAAYGEAVTTMRLHYAHSLSVGVVFAVFQHIFYTGALSMNWPSVLVAWWSNFAWAGGMIYADSMQASINNLIGNNVGNTSAVGAAPAGSSQVDLGGGYDISQIYGRSVQEQALMAYPANHPLSRNIASEIYQNTGNLLEHRSVAQKFFERSVARRDVLASEATGYKWYGQAVGNGLPLPGNYSGFAGTLAEEGLRVSNAFLTGFLWFLILLLILIGMVSIFKGALEIFSRRKWMPHDRLAFFRKHWLSYMGALLLRACFIAWFMIMTLTIFQFTYQSPASVKAIAAIVFTIFLVGLPFVAGYACMYKAKRDGSENNGSEKGMKGMLNRIPFLGPKIAPTTSIELQEARMHPESKSSSKPFWKRASSHMSIDVYQEPQYSIHDDEDYIMKFGWLASRFRRTKWWFFAPWLVYEFIRACFYAGASGHPLSQVFGLLVVEILAFCFVLYTKPFEGKRLNVLVVYCLGFSKVTTVALSAAFDVQFNLERITTTVIGIVIIVIQGFLVIITCIAILVGAATSYMSVSRNTDDFRPRKYAHLREKYFDHLDRVCNELPPEPKPEPMPMEVEPKVLITPGFDLKNMRRLAKIEDDNIDEIAVVDSNTSRASLGHRPFPPYESRPGSSATPVGRSRTASAGSMSLQHGNLPFGARPHKASWSTRDFDSYRESGATGIQAPIDMTRSVAEDAPTAAPTAPKLVHVRSSSHGSTAVRSGKLRQKSSNEASRSSRPDSSKEPYSKVPSPSTRSSRGSQGRDMRPESSRNADATADTVAGAKRQTSGKMPMLTPAQESEEFTSYFDR